jgi:Ca2+/Na+ antiporter
MPEDKLIKSGQFTLKRPLFLVVSGLVLVGVVWSGHLNIGYLLLTAVLCVLLLLVAMDYGVNMEKVQFGSATPQPNPNIAPLADTEKQAAASRDPRARKRTGKQVKRRR